MGVLRNVPLTLVIALGLASAGLVLFAAPDAWIDTLFDDAYYYLGVARHLALGHGSMFAAPLETNGYQPLWLLILTLMAALVGGDLILLAAVMHLVILSAVLVFARLAWRQEGRHWPAAATALCFPAVLLEGMETVLIFPLALLYFRADGWMRGGLASLMFLARLDTLGLIAGREVYELVVRRRMDVRAGAALALTIAAYAAVNAYAFGTPVPVSGLAKAVGNLPGENWWTGASLAAQALPALAALGLAWRFERRLRSPLPIAAALIALCCSAAYYGVFSGWPVWGWYAWPVALLFYFGLCELARGESPARPRAMVASLLFLVTFPASGYLWRYHLLPSQQTSWGQANVAMAAIVNASSPAPITFAMGDRAGSFGYFLDDRHRLIQTEGLVADLAFLDAIRRGEAEPFLDSKGTNFLVVDREYYWLDGTIYAVPEPVQGLSAHSGVMLLCFPMAAEIPSLRLRPERRVFRYDRRVTCPDAFVNELRRRQSVYGGVHAASVALP